MSSVYRIYIQQSYKTTAPALENQYRVHDKEYPMPYVMMFNDEDLMFFKLIYGNVVRHTEILKLGSV